MASEWTCCHCTFLNPDRNLNCGGCFQSKDKCLAFVEARKVFEERDYEKSYAGEEPRENGRRTGTGLSILTRIKRFFTGPRVPPPPKRWLCHRCTYSNNEILSKCEMCGVEKPRERRLLPWPFNVRQTWSPSSAEDGQPKRRSTSHTESKTWLCPHCKFVNHALLPRCEACLKDSPQVASRPFRAEDDGMLPTPGHHVTSIYDNEPDVALDEEAFELVPSLPVCDAQLDSPTQLLTGELCIGRSLSVRERRMNDEDEAAIQQAAIVQFCRKVCGGELLQSVFSLAFQLAAILQ